MVVYRLIIVCLLIINPEAGILFVFECRPVPLCLGLTVIVCIGGYGSACDIWINYVWGIAWLNEK